jgi:hypothetical protein
VVVLRGQGVEVFEDLTSTLFGEGEDVGIFEREDVIGKDHRPRDVSIIYLL